jgi:two-component system sensor histidine kinase DesK
MFIHGRLVITGCMHTRKRLETAEDLELNSTQNSYKSKDSSVVSHTSLFLWLIYVVWIPFVIPPIVDLFNAKINIVHLIITLVVATIYFCIYLAMPWHYVRYLAVTSALLSIRTPWLSICLLTLLSVGLIISNGSDWIIMFFFTSGYAVSCLRLRSAIPVTILFSLIGILISFLLHKGWFFSLETVSFTCTISALVFILMGAMATNIELQVAHEEIARLAVVTERLRIARDLHDLLGHNLSLITLKSELVGRLISLEPERATNEIADIEQVARITLQEVRETVARYRQPTLANELRGAREILAAADIAYYYEENVHIEHLPEILEGILAWTVREGVTNVIRHSRARQCTIRLSSEQHIIRIEVIDNGNSGTVDLTMPAARTKGNGLSGLAERVHSFGGQISTRPYRGSGFCLAVVLPWYQI